MSNVPSFLGPRRVARFAFAGMTAALLAGCADSSRFLGNPLGNPFHSASNTAPAANYDMAPPSYTPPRRSLPPADYAPHREASYATPAHEAPRLSPRYQAPRTEQTGSIAPASGRGSWTSDGGMAVVAATGESAAILAERYNVPTDALLRTNGFTSAAQVHPGTRVVIPVYNANGGSRVAEARPAHAAEKRPPSDHASRKRLLAERQDHERDEKAARLERMRQDKAEALADARTHEREMALAKREKAAALAEQKAHDHELALAKAERAKSAKAAAVAEAKAHDREAAMAKMERTRKDKVAALAEAEKKSKGRDKTAARLERQKAEKAEKVQMLADAKEARKAKVEAAKAERRAQVAQTREAQTKTAPVRDAAVETVREKPTKAHVEEPRNVAAVDPTPTASLPPASDKVSANGNPEFRWPAHGRIIQGFKSGGNDGINIAVPEGTSVKAAESGVVAYAGSEIKGFGNLVLIRHPNGYVTAYANNGDLEVHRGEQVKRGQVIAKSGQSGNVASPQLHFELRKGSTPVDPTRYLAGA